MECKKCKKDKSLNKFKIEKRTKLGYDTVCLECRAKKRRELRKENPELYRERDAKYRKTEKYKTYHNNYYINFKDELLERGRERYYKNPEPYKIRSQEQRKRLGDDYSKYQKEYRKRNYKKLNEYCRLRFQNNLNAKIKNLISGAIRARLKGKIKKSKTLIYLDCDINFFKGYISAQFRDGMNWENHGTVWHLDHKIPCRGFDLTKESEIYKCFHYTNYQPLLIKENLAKGDKLPSGKNARFINSSI